MIRLNMEGDFINVYFFKRRCNVTPVLEHINQIEVL
jgi:hypothetical protein